jgi:plasmid maintenance system antidote protein VapI
MRSSLVNADFYLTRCKILLEIIPTVKRRLVVLPSAGQLEGKMVGQKRRFKRTFIREWRKHRGLTLEKVADRLDMTPGHISMLERGQRGYTQETLEALASALQTDVASLLMRNPSDPDAIWSIWDQAKPAQRRQIVAIMTTVVKSAA